jgi:pilus assembly protein CpaB
MRVDVLIIGVPPGGSPADGAKVRTLLQNIQVLSAGTNFQKDAEGKAEPAQVVNLLVTPTQAEILSLAGNETRIQLTLRNPMDKEISKPPSTAVSDLFGGAQAAEPAPTKRSEHVSQAAPLPAPLAPVPVLPAPYVIDVSNGAIHTEAKFSRSPAGKQ